MQARKPQVKLNSPPATRGPLAKTGSGPFASFFPLISVPVLRAKSCGIAYTSAMLSASKPPTRKPSVLQRAFLFPRLSAVFAFLLVPAVLQAQHRGRKYTPPPATAHVTVTVVKASNGKPVESAAVVFHPMRNGKDEGNMELKTNEEGRAILDVIPIGDTVRLQVIADGFQTFGDDYLIDTNSKDIFIKLKRPARQYSIYEQHDGTQLGGASPSDSDANPPAAKPDTTKPDPNQPAPRPSDKPVPAPPQ